LSAGSGARRLSPVPALLCCIALGCAGGQAPRGPQPDAPSPTTVIVIGVDALRWDLYGTAPPHLTSLAARGASASRMVPPFPTKTFPAFYTLATGLHPGRHGLVGNKIRDPSLGDDFSLGNRDAVRDGRWYGGEPIWVTAERQGVRTATYFWPGSEAEIGGYRPTRWLPYDGSVPNADRVAAVLAWLQDPPELRPRLIMLYFSTIDEAAHDHPLDSDEVRSALFEVDEAIGALLAGIDRLGRRDSTHLVVVADHGMAPTSARRAIFVDELFDVADADYLDENPLLWIYPREGRLDALLASLRDAHPHLTVHTSDRLSERYHYRHPRVAPVIAIADEGWSIVSREAWTGLPPDHEAGTHGYDNRLPSMAAAFIAAGPAIEPGSSVDEIESVDVYPFLCRLLGIAPASSDGDPRALEACLRR
jgi:predicted AlkP superfamily pyrophosphatase or phosphodiesterase